MNERLAGEFNGFDSFGGNRGARRRKETAFTLIELLTVIAIIGILAAILIPVTRTVREQANRASCQSNVRQQILAMLLFAEDHEDNAGTPPERVQRVGGNPVAGYWWVTGATHDNAPLSLYPDYVEDLELFICPSTQNRIRYNLVAAGIYRDLEDHASGREDSRGGHSYEYFGVYTRGDLDGIVKGPNTVPHWLLSQTVLVLDADDGPELNNCPEPANNHGEAGWSWGFADGHVEWVTRQDTNDYLARSRHASPRCPN